nr:MAG TPA: hypothetical protein [Caudoviricetes sp.]
MSMSLEALSSSHKINVSSTSLCQAEVAVDFHISNDFNVGLTGRDAHGAADFDFYIILTNGHIHSTVISSKVKSAIPVALDFSLAGQDTANKNSIVSAVEPLCVWVGSFAAGDGGIAVAVKIDYNANVALFIDRPNDKSTTVDHSNWNAQHLRFVLKCIFVRIPCKRLYVDFHVVSIKGYHLNNIGHADTGSSRLLLSLLVCLLSILSAHAFSSSKRFELHGGFPVPTGGTNVLALHDDILAVQLFVFDLHLLGRADVVVEQHFPGNVLAVLALGGRAFLRVRTDSQNRFVRVALTQQQTIFRGQLHTIGHALGRVRNHNAFRANQEAALAVRDNDPLEDILHLTIADKAPVVDLLNGQRELANLQPHEVQEICYNVLRCAALLVGLGDLGVEPLFHSSSGGNRRDGVYRPPLGSASTDLPHKDCAHVALITGIEDNSIASLDSFPCALGEVVDGKRGLLQGIAVLEGHFKLEIEIIHAVLFTGDLQGRFSQPKTHAVLRSYRYSLTSFPKLSHVTASTSSPLRHRGMMTGRGNRSSSMALNRGRP